MINLKSVLFYLFLLPIFSVQLFAQTLPNTDQSIALKALDVRSLYITSSSTNNSLSFTIDAPNDDNLFDVTSLDESVSISLILPNGTEVNSTNGAAQGFIFSKISDGGYTTPLISPFSRSGTHTTILLPKTITTGIYQIKVDSHTISNSTAVSALFLSSSPIRASSFNNSGNYSINDKVILTGAIFNGSTPVTNASVTAKVMDRDHPDAPSTTITLLDSGELDDKPNDGLYTGTFVPAQSGRFIVAMRFSGTTSTGVAFSRAASTEFTVTPPLATFTSFSDGPLDSDGDIDNFEGINLNANVTVLQSGKYQFSATLSTSTGAEINESRFFNLSQGSRLISLPFAAEDILRLGTDGPYTIKIALLTYQDDTNHPVADCRNNAGNTGSYPLDIFRHPQLALTGINTATGINTDNNGKFDVLRIQIGMTTPLPGVYQWSGTLVDSLGREIDVSGGQSPAFFSGPNIMLDFDGRKIGQSGMNGPYTVRSFSLYGRGKSVYSESLLTTQPFTVAQFEDSRQVDLSLSGSDTPNQNLIGYNIPYVLTVLNNGRYPVTGAKLTQNVPSVLTFISASPSQGSCSFASGTLNCVLGDLATGAAATINITLSATSTGSLTSSASVSSDQSDLDPTNNTISFNYSVISPNLPSGWSGQDIGNSNSPGMAGYRDGTFYIRSAGSGLAGTTDKFHFVHRPVSGDGEIVARVVSVMNTNPDAKAGITFREALDTGSSHVTLDLKPSGLSELLRRSILGGSTETLTNGSQALPQWLKLARRGNTFTAYLSDNGIDWALCGQTTVSMGTTVFVGLVVESHDEASSNTAVFDNVEFNTFWTASPGPVGGHVGSIVNSGNVIIATAGSGIYRSVDNGDHWQPINQGLTDPHNQGLLLTGMTLYAGTFAGVHKSTDNGGSWTYLSAGLPQDRVRALALNGTTLIAGTEWSGIYMSSNEGQSWSAAATQPSNTSILALTANGGKVFAATEGGGIFSSADNGQTWVNANNGLPGLYCRSLLSIGSTVYAGITDYGVYQTNDGGQSWSLLADGVNPWVTSLGFDGTTMYAGTGGGMLRSPDGGQTWQSVDMNFAGNPPVVSLAAGSSNFFAGTDVGGIYRSGDSGQSWEFASNGYVNTQVWEIVTQGNYVFAGAWGAGVARSTDNGQTWTTVKKGLNVQALTITNDGTLYVGTYGGDIYVSSDHGDTWSAFAKYLLPWSASGRLAIKGSTFFASTGGDGIWRSTDGGQTWAASNDGLTEFFVNEVVATDTRIYAATPSGVFVSTNNGTSWAAMNNGLTNLNVKTLAVAGTTLLAGTEDGIYASADYGQTWTAASSGLLSTYINKFALNGNSIYAATNGGIYVSNDNGAQWTAIDNDGLPDYFVLSLGVNNNKVFAGTLEHGVFTKPSPF